MKLFNLRQLPALLQLALINIRNELNLKDGIAAMCGIGAMIIYELFGGWDANLTTLALIMAADYGLGVACALFFKKSKKTKNGALSSKAMGKGLTKKVAILVLIMLAYRIDLTFGCDYFKNGFIYAYIAREALSIIETTGLMGVKWPPIVKEAVELLKEKEGEEGGGKDGK